MTARHYGKAKILLIGNPNSGKGVLKKKWQDEIQPFLHGKLRLFDVEFTKKRGDGIKLTRQALQNGYNLVIAMGGDGTLNEIVNGYYQNLEPINPDAAIGILPFGSGGDFIRTLGIERDYRKAVTRITSGRIKKLDVGICLFDDTKIQPRYFINIANAGVVASIMKRVNGFNRQVPSTVRYFTGTLLGFQEYKNIKVRLRIQPDGGTQVVSLTNLVIANGKYFGSGMRPALLAQPDDGLFDIVILKNLQGMAFLPHLPELYTGRRLLPSKNIETLRATEIHVEVLGQDRLYHEMDGENYGEGSVTFKILPQSVKFIV